MKNSLPEDKKLSVTYRVEPGCLGPDGKNYVNAFCDFAQKTIQSMEADHITWHIIPRNDKSLPEMQYSILGKNMNDAQAKKYLAIFGKKFDEFEGYMGDKLALLIDDFLSQ